MPTTRRLTSLRLDEELLAGLREVYERDGVTPAEQVRRAVRAWLGLKGVGMKKAERKRAATRRRS